MQEKSQERRQMAFWRNSSRRQLMQMWQLLQIQCFCILGKVISNIKSSECGTGGGEMLQPLLEKPPTAKKKKNSQLYFHSFSCKRSSPCRCLIQKQNFHMLMLLHPSLLCFHYAWGLGFVPVCTLAKEVSSKPFYQKEGVRDDVSLVHTWKSWGTGPLTFEM